MINKVWLPLVGIIVVSTVMTASVASEVNDYSDIFAELDKPENSPIPMKRPFKNVGKRPADQSGKIDVAKTVSLTGRSSKLYGKASSSPGLSHCDDLVVYELKALVKLVLEDPNNEGYKNSIREIVNDHIRTYERPRDGEGYANYVHICCCPLMDNKFTKELSHEIWSALDNGRQMIKHRVTET